MRIDSKDSWVDTLIMEIIDNLLQRREVSWYVGKVIYVPPAYSAVIDWPSGYYRAVGMMENGNWDVVWIGEQMPLGEPVYINDGHRDLKAVPSTVRPAGWKWLLWVGIYLALALITWTNVYPDDRVFWLLILIPVACQPFFDWWMAIEPVRGTKTAMAILGTEAAIAAKQRHDRQEMAAINDRLRSVLGTDGKMGS